MDFNKQEITHTFAVDCVMDGKFHTQHRCVTALKHKYTSEKFLGNELRMFG